MKKRNNQKSTSAFFGPDSTTSETHYADSCDSTEALILAIVQNILQDKSLIPSLLAHIAQFSPRSRGSPCRNISQHEIIRPRDLPIILGISRTQCWIGIPAKPTAVP